MAETDGGIPNEGYEWETIQEYEPVFNYDPETDRIIDLNAKSSEPWTPPPSSWEKMDASLKGYLPFDQSKGFNQTPMYSPAPPLSKIGDQVYDSSAGGGIAQAGRPPLFQVIDTIKSRPGNAKEAMQYVLDQTYGTTEHLPVIDPLVGAMFHSNFGGIGGSKGDTGFLPELQDDKYYSQYWGKQTPESTQLGHFLTAVDFGIDGGDWLKSVMIRHEQIPIREG